MIAVLAPDCETKKLFFNFVVKMFVAVFEIIIVTKIVMKIMIVFIIMFKIVIVMKVLSYNKV